MTDFRKEDNRLEIKKQVIETRTLNNDPDGFEEIYKTGDVVTENYRYTDDEGLEIKKTLQTLFAERLDGMPDKDDDLIMDDKKSKELEKKNKKYSDKDRRDSVKLAKSIRKKKMGDLLKEYEKKKNKYAKKNQELSAEEEIKFKEKLIDLDAMACEAYIKAYAIMNDKEKVDLAMNKMRALYRKIGVYLEYLRTGQKKIPMEKLMKIQGKADAAKAEENRLRIHES